MTRHSRTKPREHERRDRRAALDVLLARAQRGRLSRAEAVMLRAYVTEEQRAADESRSTNAGTTRALERTRAGADEAIRSLETELAEQRQAAADASEQLRQYRAVFGENALDAHAHALARASRAEGALARVRDATGQTSAHVAVVEYDRAARVDAEERADRYRLHSEKLWHQLAAQRHRASSMETAARVAEHDRAALEQRVADLEADLAQQTEQPQPARCVPAVAGPDHPIHALTEALTADRALDHLDAGQLIRRYYDAVHTVCCPLEHDDPRPGRAAEADLAQLTEDDLEAVADEPIPYTLAHP